MIPARLNLAREALEGPLRAGLGSKVALIGPEGQLTYDQLDAQSGTFAAACAARGIGRGDRVLLRTWNCLEFAVAFLALAKIGAVPVMQNSAAGLADVEYVLEHSGAVAAIALAPLAEPLRALASRLPKGLIVARGAAAGENAFEDMVLQGGPGRFEARERGRLDVRLRDTRGRACLKHGRPHPTFHSVSAAANVTARAPTRA